MGEKIQDALRIQFEKRIRLTFHGARITSDAERWRSRQAASTNTLNRFETEVLVSGENLRGRRQLNAGWVEQAMVRTSHHRIILDMDSHVANVSYPDQG
jgi:hypothetical protein